MKREALFSLICLGFCAFEVAVGCSSTTIIQPAPDASKPVEPFVEPDAPPLEDADVDAGYCFNPGPPADAASAAVFGNCVPHDRAEDTFCVEYAGIGVSFAESTVKSNCMTDSKGTWTTKQACDRTNLAGGCRQISRISNLCETVVTYWYKAGGDAGTTQAGVQALCKKQGNATFLAP